MCLISGSWPEPQLERLTHWPLRLTSRGQCLPGDLASQAVAPLPSLPDSQISLESHGCWILRRGQLPLWSARWGRGTCPFPLVPQHEPEGLGTPRAAAPLLIPLAAWVSGDPPGICTRGEVGMMGVPQEGPWNGAQRPGFKPSLWQVPPRSRTSLSFSFLVSTVGPGEPVLSTSWQGTGWMGPRRPRGHPGSVRGVPL